MEMQNQTANSVGLAFSPFYRFTSGMSSTDMRAKPFPGPRLYQQRAAAAFPILVEQAKKGHSIRYKPLARRLGMANARNLNYVLGSIGNRLQVLSSEKRTTIPPIVSLVVNGMTGLPGKGGWSFLGVAKPTGLSKSEQRAVFRRACARIWNYRKWDAVLKWVGLKPAASDLEDLAASAAQGRGGGESKAHRLLKEFLADQPAAIGLGDFAAGSTESRLPSGDRLDIRFENQSELVAVEVKTRTAGDDDLARGLFQCIKYQAVLDAEMGVGPAAKRKQVRVLLATPAVFSPLVAQLHASLGVTVVMIANSSLPKSLR
jgi:hypothetical protein